MKKAEHSAAKETDGGDQNRAKRRLILDLDSSGENQRSCCSVNGGYLYISK